MLIIGCKVVTGEQLVTLGQQVAGGSNGLFAITWSPDGKHVVAGGIDVQVWNVAKKTIAFTYTVHSGSISAVRWSPDGKYVASGGSDRTVQVWQGSNGSHILGIQIQ